MSGQGSDTTPSGGNDTQQGASFAAMVPFSGTSIGATATYSDLTRLGAIDPTDEPVLNADPADATSKTFAQDGSASPFAAGGLFYTLDTLQLVGPDSYLRVGTPSHYEWWLTNDPTKPQPPAKPGTNASMMDLDPPLGGEGVALHSSNQISFFAPTINQSSNTSLNVTWASSSRIGILAGQVQDAAGTLTNATYQVVDDLTTTVGNVLNTVAGQSATVWTGADASTGLGSLLWSNFGATQNVFGGMVTNMTNGAVEVQGWGETKFQSSTVFAPDQILLAVAGIAVPNTLATRFSTATKAINITAAACIGVVSTLIAMQTGIAADKAGKDKSGKDALMTALDNFKIEMWVLTGLTAALQIAGTALGIVLSKANIPTADTAASKITMTDSKIVLSAGGTQVTIDGNGFNVDAGNPALTVMANANIAQVAIQSQIANANQGAFVTQGVVAGPVMVGGAVAIPTKTVSFSSLGPFTASATAIQFTLPTT